jgi:hypothetical protein
VPPPTRARDLVAGAVVLLVTLSVLRLFVDRQMMLHVASLRRHHSFDPQVPVVERLRRFVKAAVWLGRLAVAVTLVSWMARARRIVQAYDCDLYRSDVDFAVAGWFLPPMNIIAPYLLMADVWTASHPSRRPEAIIDRLRVPRRIKLWWGLFLVSGFLGLMEARDLAAGGGTWAPFDVHIDYVMTGCQIVSALLLLWIVVRATDFIQQRYDAAPATSAA